MFRAHHRSLAALLAVLALFAVGPACGSDDDGAAAPTTTDAQPSAGGSTAATAAPPDPSSLGPVDLAESVCALAGEGDEGEVVGRVQNPTLVETSGIVASAAHPGTLWAHNDSGGEPVIYAVGTDGSDRGVWEVTGAEARDWEEIAGWYDADADEHHLYLADIGDNASQRDDVQVYEVPEPDVATGGGATAPAREYRLRYPDGAHDAETFFVDPATGDWYVLTKGWGTGISQVFRAADPTVGGTTTLEDTGVTVNLKELGSYATAGDADGIVVVRTYDEVVVWPLEGEVTDALAAPGCAGPSADEPQGEAVAIAPDRTGYYTISEGPGAPIHWFPFTP